VNFISKKNSNGPDLHIGFGNQQQLHDFVERNIKYFTRYNLSMVMEMLSKTEKKECIALWNKKDLVKLEAEVEKEVQHEEKS